MKAATLMARHCFPVVKPLRQKIASKKCQKCGRKEGFTEGHSKILQRHWTRQKCSVAAIYSCLLLVAIISVLYMIETIERCLIQYMHSQPFFIKHKIHVTSFWRCLHDVWLSQANVVPLHLSQLLRIFRQVGGPRVLVRTWAPGSPWKISQNGSNTPGKNER